MSNSIKVAVCNEEDCPLHPSNSFRVDMEKQLPEMLESYNKKSMDLKFLKELNELFMLQYEYQSIPTLCSFCSFKQNIDIKSEVTAFIAKRNLTDE